MPFVVGLLAHVDVSSMRVDICRTWCFRMGLQWIASMVHTNNYMWHTTMTPKGEENWAIEYTSCFWLVLDHNTRWHTNQLSLQQDEIVLFHLLRCHRGFFVNEMYSKTMPTCNRWGILGIERQNDNRNSPRPLLGHGLWGLDQLPYHGMAHSGERQLVRGMSAHAASDEMQQASWPTMIFVPGWGW